MAKRTRIGILGIGAVGGYLGGLLADHYAGSDDTTIVFISKPATAEILRKKGLMLVNPSGDTRVVYAHEVICPGDEAEALDYLLCTVKSYDLQESLAQARNYVSDKTVIIPFLNGVDAEETIRSVYPLNPVAGGCIYLVSRLLGPGQVKETGNIHSLYFGSDHTEREKLLRLKSIFDKAGIECYLSENITRTVWEKFFFTAGMANATSYFNENIGEVLANKEHKALMRALLEELKEIADKKQIVFDGDIVKEVIAKMEKLNPESTSSMHSDFIKGGRTEYLSITGYAVKLGDELHVSTPVFDQIFNALQQRDQLSSS